jgi:hypothetical protein
MSRLIIIHLNIDIKIKSLNDYYFETDVVFFFFTFLISLCPNGMFCLLLSFLTRLLFCHIGACTF